MTDRRFIEESFPVKEVGEASAREKNTATGTSDGRRALPGFRPARYGYNI
jgi:adenine-specific DNA methylase